MDVSLPAQSVPYLNFFHPEIQGWESVGIPAERLFQGYWNSWSRHDQAPGQVLARRVQPYFS